MVERSWAREILSATGWLSRQTREFQAEIFQRAVPVRYEAGDVIYRVGDPGGGLYGVVSGAAMVLAAPPGETPHFLHLLTPGEWVGELPFLCREPRRVGLKAALRTEMIYLSLEAIEHIARCDAMATRRFTQIHMQHLDILMRAYCDLQNPIEHRRIALALLRVYALENTPIPLAQAELGMLANTSRKTVNAALRRFASAGWVKTGYRSVTITDLESLGRFAEDGTR